MDDPDDLDLTTVEATVAELTARAPDSLFVIDGEIEDDDAWADVFELCEAWEGDAIVETDLYPRNAGPASGFYQALKALRLPSGATVYYQVGEFVDTQILALAATGLDDEAAAQLGEVIGLPTYFHAGGTLLEIDRHLSAGAPNGWIFEALVDHRAEWIEQGMLDEGEARRAELQQAIDDSREEGDCEIDLLDREEGILGATPGWFLLLGEPELERIAAYELPGAGHEPPLENTFHPWRKPTGAIFFEPADPSNLQHIVAAYLIARGRG